MGLESVNLDRRMAMAAMLHHVRKSGDTMRVWLGGESGRLGALQALHLFAWLIARSGLESAHVEAGTHSGSGGVPHHVTQRGNRA